METDNNQTSTKKNSGDGPGNKLKDKLPIISAFSAITAALLSAFVSIWVTFIQADIDELIATKQDTVERARLFRELIGELKTEDTAGFALLTLWKIYQQEKDREVVVLAALERPNQNTIMTLTRLGFEKELEKYADTIQNLAILGTGETSEAASSIILRTFSPLQVAEYLVDKISNFGASGPNDESVLRLIELVRTDHEVKELVSRTVTKANFVNPYFGYVQYRTGEKDSFMKYLEEVKSRPELYGDYIELANELRQSDFDNDDWLEVIKVAVAILENDGEAIEPYILSGSFDLIGRINVPTYRTDEVLNETIASLLKGYIFGDKIGEVERYSALDLLINWNSIEALKVIAEYRACGNELDHLISVSVEDLLDIDEVVNFKPKPFAIEATSEEWRQWLKDVNGSNDAICKTQSK